MKRQQAHKLITCIVPHGHALPVLKALKDELGIVTANIHHARGSGRMTPLAWRGVGETTEKDILSVIVPAGQADSVFAFVFDRAEINRPHGGLMFQQPVNAVTPFELPDLPDDK